MDAVIERIKNDPELKVIPQDADDRPTRAEAEAAVRTLIKWAGDNPDREGLIETPKRVAKAYEEFFAGYHDNPEEILSRTFEEVEGYDDMVVLRGIQVESHCEHHMVPVQGTAHVAYMPNGRVVGISKLARVVEAFARRLQTQETMTAQIADAIEKYLKPKGVAVIVDATHQCMTCRGVKHQGVYTITRQFRGCFKEAEQERRFWDLIRG
ncbi:GTP cyclohydrolase I FolE [Kordiimonas marina]|uniref:GTP cyclohydrolase I FolE n=1 Tax=Kordiimonas marina TaxID=2872312 RepID=UPI001FF44C83|nr:GTP cyclohydrolase I FolE [Kordiimonas marina]MCJ9428503.1 GTP cyclohydrolase I FolE [Kordiimonas marina]